MESLVSYDFICVNDPTKSFKLNIEKSEEAFNDFGWLLEVAEETAASKGAKFNFRGSLYLDHESLLRKKDQSVSYFADLAPFYYNDLYESTCEIFVKPTNGKTFPIHCRSFDTISDMKKRIKEMLPISLDDQAIVFGKKVLEDDCTLSYYNIEKRATVILVPILHGGGEVPRFVNMENTDGVEIREFSDSAPDWRIVTSGLNVEGICKNSSCKAYNRRVLFRIGYGVFDLLREGKKCKCPMCKKIFLPITCGFHNCYYNWVGHKIDQETDDLKKYNGTIYKKVYNNFEYYNPEKSGDTEWSDLKIITVKSLNEKCTVCYKLVKETDTDAKINSCHHQYHISCFEKVKEILKRDCPACLEH